MSPEPEPLSIEPDVMETLDLTPVRHLGGRANQHWIVERGGVQCVLRRSAEIYEEIEYELEILRRLHDLEWPVPEVIEQPLLYGGVWWCLFSFLKGSASRLTGAEEQRARGRLLAELHETTATLTGLGQRSGFGRTDEIVMNPALSDAVKSYESIRPDIGHMFRRHIDLACERLERLDRESAEEIVIHSDFAPWNLLYDEAGALSGVLDFESTHMDFRVADFALSWRGTYDDVVRGYEEVHPLSELDRQLLVPAFWGWLFQGVTDEIQAIMEGESADHGFEWLVGHLARRSPLFEDLAAPYPGPANMKHR